MRNPLNRRLLRELKAEIAKYIVILVLMVLSIGAVSGFLVADDSVTEEYNEGFTKYNLEDGHFVTAKEMNKAQVKAVEALGVTVYEDDYVNEKTVNDTTVRVYRNREEVNLACVMSGKLPQKADEIALDRMYAVNNDIAVGDSIPVGNGTYLVTGLIALPDYSCLFENNSDMMFDSVSFGVALMTPEGFDALGSDNLCWCYAWKYDSAPADEQEENSMSEDFQEGLTDEVHLDDYVPRYLNQSITFTGEDMGSDRGSMIAFLYIVIAIMAFVIGVTTSNTIVKEANVIGTLRASGYTRGELTKHYMIMPVAVTLVGALLGNILGYTVIEDIVVDMYYNSYSLATYVTIPNRQAFILTTVIPVVMMAVINFVILRSKLRLSPLKFIRRDLTGKHQKHVVRLNGHLPFFSRFRIRVIFQNMPSYAILFVGIVFANLLLLFGIGFPELLDYYEETITDSMFARYQYMLTMPVGMTDDDRKLESMITMLRFSDAVETDTEDAEKFSAYALKTMPDASREEDITVYGIEPDSAYVDLDLDDGDVYISRALAEKFEIAVGDTVSFRECYEDKSYEFTVTGLYDYYGGMYIFMNRGTLNEKFDLGDDYFCGYFSDTGITDIDSKYIGSVIDYDTMTKVSRQLRVSMGSMMGIVDVFAVIMFIFLVFLLSKIIIEKNAQSISMVKILGYTNSEISRLYIISTTIVYALSLLISLPIVYQGVKLIFVIMMRSSMSGWFPIVLGWTVYAKMLVLGAVSYAVVAVFEYRRIQKVPMDEALKNVE